VEARAWPPRPRLASGRPPVPACSARAGFNFSGAAQPGASRRPALSASLRAPGPSRCPGNQNKPLKSCNIFAADFAADGIIQPCDSTITVQLDGTGPGVIGALLK
jgi:hypothetical protein